MLTLQKNTGIEVVSKSIINENIQDLLDKEWILSNKRGGFSSSTITGCNTRRYHGLLIGSLTPPTNRIMALAHCMEMIVTEEESYNLSTFEFNEKFTPEGFRYLWQFRKDSGVHFDYQVNDIRLSKSIYLLEESDTVAVEYDFEKVDKPFKFTVRPFAGLRDYHSLQKSYAKLVAEKKDGGVLVGHNVPKSCKLFLYGEDGKFQKDPNWWFNFIYRVDRERGQDFSEDLWTPGFFSYQINKPTKVVLWGNLSNFDEENPEETIKGQNLDKVRRSLRDSQNSIILKAKAKDNNLKKLCLAADEFVTIRNIQQDSNGNGDTEGAGKDETRTTILAGYPWFADWGRDAFISLDGLLLETGQYDKARSVLTTFAHVVSDGMIPNRFDDYSDTACFNSIDASLWFIHAAFLYLKKTADKETFENELLSVIRMIIDSYSKGTKFGIHADSDGLITGGNSDTQLTWMDAKCHGVAFTPRYGKAVEINALWYNGLCWLAEYFMDIDVDAAYEYHCMADGVEISFQSLFWNQEKRYLNDCVFPDGRVDGSLRPNQIFAVSLPFSPLTLNQQKAIVEVIESKLLTPFGLRSLDSEDSNYHGVYTGGQMDRDRSYHQGTVWAFLMGPFIESYLKVHSFDAQSKKKACEYLEPLIEHFTDDGCMGSISEIFDGDSPYKPKGCFAQAWSVAEVIRAYKLMNS